MFKKWRDVRVAVKKRKQDELEAERRKKGILNGREIFMQVGGWVGGRSGDEPQAQARWNKDAKQANPANPKTPTCTPHKTLYPIP